MFWSKDRNSFASDHPNRMVDAFINSSNKISTCVTKDYDHTNQQCVTQEEAGQPTAIAMGHSGLVVDTWYYLVYSYDDTNGGEFFEITVHVDTINFILITYSDFLIRDDKTWPLNIALNRESTPGMTLSNKLHGFISMVVVW